MNTSLAIYWLDGVHGQEVTKTNSQKDLERMPPVVVKDGLKY